MCDLPEEFKSHSNLIVNQSKEYCRPLKCLIDILRHNSCKGFGRNPARKKIIRSAVCISVLSLRKDSMLVRYALVFSRSSRAIIRIKFSSPNNLYEILRREGAGRKAFAPGSMEDWRKTQRTFSFQSLLIYSDSMVTAHVATPCN